ncbi:ATP-grasp domain-containing protein [Achromobacter pestifer]|uniref:ATP-grasp domain-containing protein n=2 Tax=Achromobacter pestifer TaxID=1353889 RepID=A0A7D4E896_9BURK|nr:ATP-grasp domain-containing protein [Achromobacter pestifer]
MADAACHAGGSAARESYLNIGKIVGIAREANCDAIHPGYGLLSENAEFASACIAAGLIFIGPAPDAIAAMGQKDAAKRLASRADVPVLPTIECRGRTSEEIARHALALGFPLLIKAVAGGGGRGMRRVDAASQLDAAIDAARREALASFGNEDLLIEPYLEQSRHIEVQVFADGSGTATALGERDCSVQRRHQKVIEEAPAPDISEALRTALFDAALKLVRAIRYQGAGTVEFIVDTSRGRGAERFYFMEMNTRLQVEHTVTEMTTGLDLVEWQIRVARGETLPDAASAPAASGHAIEVRICAENPAKNYLPSPGAISLLQFPAPAPGIRVDAGVRQGDKITPWYDSLIAKLIVHAQDRSSCCDRLVQALDECRVEGVHTNLPLLRAIARSAEFRLGAVTTNFLSERQSALLAPAMTETRNREDLQ